MVVSRAEARLELMRLRDALGLSEEAGRTEASRASELEEEVAGLREELEEADARVADA